MPALSKKDPRYYVKQVPLPIPPQKGIKIQARNDKVFNPTVPARDEIRQANYKRRQEQMTSQGFRCAQYKPYQGIGDPFHLDHKKLILHALGQLEETEQAETSDSSESEDEEERVKQLQQQIQGKAFTTTNFFVRRTRKDLNTIPKKHQQGKELIRNVRLGHGLFYMLRRERQQKAEAEQRAIRKRQDALKYECQPPKRESDSEAETDEDFDEDVELNDYMNSSTVFDHTTAERVAGVGETFLTETKHDDVTTTGGYHSTACDTSLVAGTDSHKLASRVNFTGTSTPFSLCVDDVEGTGTRVRSAKSTVYTRASSAKSSRRKGPAARPYTPQHVNIKREYTPQHVNIKRDNASEIDETALFRQLCALCWLLEAMSTDNPNIMAPISQCWNVSKEIGGAKGKDREKERESLDSKWKSFVTKQTMLRVSRRGPSRVTAKPRRFTSTTQRPSNPRGSLAGVSHVSIAETPTGSVSVLNESLNMSTLGPTLLAPNIKVQESMEKDSGADTLEEEEDDTYTKGLFRFLDEYYDSLRSKDGGDAQNSTADDKQSNADGTSVLSARSDKRTSEMGAGGRRSRVGPSVAFDTPVIPEYKDLTPQQISNILESIERSYIDPRLHKLSNPTERRTSKTMRADINVRPKSSPAVLEFKASLPSTKRRSMTSEMRQEFNEVSQNKALILHDALEALEREKSRKIHNKFIHLPTKGSSFQRAVRQMRCRSVAEEVSLRESQRRQSVYQQWFTDLDTNIPSEIKQDWYINKVLQRLQDFGVNALRSDGVVMMKKMEANKQSPYNFLMVLGGLRDWEICAPDISAAIEFCREKIVEMSVEDYEDWFHQKFPKVVRPRPQTAPAACKHEEREQREQRSARRLGNSTAVPMSAPPGRSRRALTAAS